MSPPLTCGARFAASGIYHSFEETVSKASLLDPSYRPLLNCVVLPKNRSARMSEFLQLSFRLFTGTTRQTNSRLHERLDMLRRPTAPLLGVD